MYSKGCDTCAVVFLHRIKSFNELNLMIKEKHNMEEAIFGEGESMLICRKISRNNGEYYKIYV
ncbi:hypothetical protein [Clostridium saccharoperbutylacetonicum]|uniref:hypothetical protein n=1 Tax=Clostridium saccharoperbutylacetonicum TaxID=36745 RepID=UPI000983EB33|nr:hypothetical protein [Clostridium saccharoperbutylacetonicum]AQR93142.1 hypothetical protein CLSAP_04190 [Clostridium saccharoperbutylacetonicum]NSB34554.1 hypothetical protein [Clostridium saccharoperbutylacetonicum]